MSTIKSGYINILENSTVAIFAGTQDTTKPIYRLYDRVVNRDFGTTNTNTVTIKIDQGATTILPITNMIIPFGHNLNGATLNLTYSDNDIAYFDAVAAFVQGDALVINKSFATQTHRYWKFHITTPPVIPNFAELFLTEMTTWNRNPSYPSGAMSDILNVSNSITASGHDRFIKRGEPKKQRDYRLRVIDETQRTIIEDINSSMGDGKPFYIVDHEGTTIYCKLARDMNLNNIFFERYDADFSVVEVI